MALTANPAKQLTNNADKRSREAQNMGSQEVEKITPQALEALKLITFSDRGLIRLHSVYYISITSFDNINI